jgi:hypothetical protein
MLEKLKKKLQEKFDQIQVLVEDDVATARIDICNSCEFLVKKVDVCKICHCYMPAKTKLKAASCPKNKW